MLRLHVRANGNHAVVPFTARLGQSVDAVMYGAVFIHIRSADKGLYNGALNIVFFIVAFLNLFGNLNVKNNILTQMCMSINNHKNTSFFEKALVIHLTIYYNTFIE